MKTRAYEALFFCIKGTVYSIVGFGPVLSFRRFLPVSPWSLPKIEIAVSPRHGGAVRGIACTEGQSTTWDNVSFRSKQIHNPKSTRPLLKDAWYGLLRTLAQE
jgi:hypothetical protein